MQFLKEFVKINNELSIDEHTLLFGNEMINDKTNTQTVLLVQKFIQHLSDFVFFFDRVFRFL